VPELLTSLTIRDRSLGSGFVESMERNAVHGSVNVVQIEPMGEIMKKLAAVAMVPFFAGFLFAQSDRTTRTETTTTTTWNGTLLDEGCKTTHTKETKSDENKTETKTTTTTECPVTTTTTSFGLMTSDGKYVRFDEAGNTRIVEIMKKNKNWTTFINEHKPISVRVVGSPNGDVVVIKEIQ